MRFNQILRRNSKSLNSNSFSQLRRRPEVECLENRELLSATQDLMTSLVMPTAPVAVTTANTAVVTPRQGGICTSGFIVVDIPVQVPADSAPRQGGIATSGFVVVDIPVQEPADITEVDPVSCSDDAVIVVSANETPAAAATDVAPSSDSNVVTVVTSTPAPVTISTDHTPPTLLQGGIATSGFVVVDIPVQTPTDSTPRQGGIATSGFVIVDIPVQTPADITEVDPVSCCDDAVIVVSANETPAAASTDVAPAFSSDTVIDVSSTPAPVTEDTSVVTPRQSGIATSGFNAIDIPVQAPIACADITPASSCDVAIDVSSTTASVDDDSNAASVSSPDQTVSTTDGISGIDVSPVVQGNKSDLIPDVETSATPSESKIFTTGQDGADMTVANDNQGQTGIATTDHILYVSPATDASATVVTANDVVTSTTVADPVKLPSSGTQQSLGGLESPSGIAAIFAEGGQVDSQSLSDFANNGSIYDLIALKTVGTAQTLDSMVSQSGVGNLGRDLFFAGLDFTDLTAGFFMLD